MADEDRAGESRASWRGTGKVLLRFAFAFQGRPEEEPPELSDQVYQRMGQSLNEPIFPLQPRQAVLPIPELAEAAAGLGHVNIAFDRDGAPRYDYLAMPFRGDFVPSLPVRAAALYRGLPWDQVGLALG